MKKNSIKIGLSVILGFVIAASSVAQTVNSSYFIDGSFDKHFLNPALTPERGYISLPVLGGYSVTLNSNVGLSNFLYESKTDPGMLTTFMSSEIDKNKFLQSLPDVSRIDMSIDMELLTLGFKAFGGFNTLSMSLKNRETISIPQQMFGFMKASLSDGDYLIENVNVNSVTFLETSIGHSHKITDNITVGAKVKFLTGVAYADANINQLKAKVSEQSWVVNANVEVRAAATGVTVTTNTSDEGVIEDFETEILYQGTSSTGFAFDLGALYDMSDLVDGLSVSASVTDIGGITWKDMVVGKTKNQDIVFDGFDSYDVLGGHDDETDEIGQFEDDFQNMIKLYEAPSETQKINIGATVRVGAEYTLPFADWISVGELFTYRMGLRKYTESRTSLVLSPTRWFDLSGNVAFTSTYGTVLGFVVNLHPAGFNLFLASDGIKATLNPQMIPVSEFGTNILMGIKIPVGKRLY